MSPYTLAGLITVAVAVHRLGRIARALDRIDQRLDRTATLLAGAETVRTLVELGAWVSRENDEAELIADTLNNGRGGDR